MKRTAGVGWTIAWALAAVVTSGCGDDAAVPDAGSVDGSVDAVVSDAVPGEPVDAGGIPDGATLCETADECNDDVECTLDLCDPRGFCRNPPSTAACEDGDFCNGVEQCDPVEGCIPGPPQSCNDNDVCTIDRCDREMQACIHSPRDFDEDGEADWRCEGGTDCDDFDATRGSTVAEVCSDVIDNDCDGLVDEDECGRPEHDTCGDPLDVGNGGTFVLSNEGATADYALGCGSEGRKDLVLSLTLDERQDVTITAQGNSATWVGLRETCADADSEIECASGFPGQARVRALDPGTYSIIVADAGSGDVQVRVELSEPTPPPEHESCDSAMDVSGGGRFDDTFLDVSDDLSMACGAADAPDLVYSFTTDTTRDVILSASSATGDALSFSVRSACADDATAVRCARGSPAATRIYSLPAGTWFVVLEGPSSREVDFRIDLSFAEPSSPPAGDSCAEPLPLPLGEDVSGTLTDKQDDHRVECGFFYLDAVYSFEIEEHSDLLMTLDGSSFMNFSLRSECGEPAEELRCAAGRPAQTIVRHVPPGTYFVIAEAARSGGFTLRVDAEPSAGAPTPVAGNESCDTPHVVPASGGLFAGDTSVMDSDHQTMTCGSMAGSPDAVFQLTLDQMSRVTASTEGSAFDTVLYLQTGRCIPGLEVACDDDGGADGQTSRIDEVLSAGTWLFVVDGWGGGSSGEYNFDLVVSDP